MRRGMTALALIVPLSVGLIASGGIAQAKPLPPAAVMQGLLLTTDEMVKATGYAGQLADAGGSSCTDTDEGGRDCSAGAQPADWDNPAAYPYLVLISGFPTTAASAAHWRNHNLKPQPWNGETITIVATTSKSITYTSVPADPQQMASAWTSIKGKQGIMMAACGANSQAPDLTAVAECSRKLATALMAKVKAKRPKTPLA